MKPSADYTSRELFHFVGLKDPLNHEANFATLCTILNTGWVLHPGGVPSWGIERITINPSKSILSGGMIVPEVVCFADIPRHALEIHVKKYGIFGLSLARTHLLRYGTRPVMYFPYNVDVAESRYGIPCLSDIEVAFMALRKHLKDVETPKVRTMGRPPETMNHAAKAFSDIALKEFLAFVKPFDSQLHEDAANNFYMEREWRRLGNMGFNVQDVHSVVVPSNFMDRAKKTFSPYADKLRTIEELIDSDL